MGETPRDIYTEAIDATAEGMVEHGENCTCDECVFPPIVETGRTETLDSLRAERDAWRRGMMLVLDELAGFEIGSAPHVRVRRLRRSLDDVEEREAAVCPEDVPFDEYVRTLWQALRPFAAMHQVDADPDEAVLVRGQRWVLNRDLERAASLVPKSREENA